MSVVGALTAISGACVAPPASLRPDAAGPVDATALRGEPVLRILWDPDEPPASDAPPEIVTYRDGHGARFEPAGRDYAALGPDEAARARLQGAFTVEVELRLEGRPGGQASVLSAWQTVDGSRCFELGVDRDQQPYVVVSEAGLAGSGLAQLTGTRQLRFGVDTLLTAIFTPGRSLELRLNGREAGRLEAGVPPRAHVAEVPVWVGNRPGAAAAHGLRAVVGRLELFDRALPVEASAAWAEVRGLAGDPSPFAPVRAITRGPGYHWFGYYDKAEFDVTGRYALGQAVGFERRLPTAADAVTVGMIDLAAGDRFVPLGESRAWSWQQGSMLQWLPGATTEIIFNDRWEEGDPGSGPFVSRILDVFSRQMRTLPRPIYHVSPRGDVAIGTDFQRLGEAYGYPPLVDTTTDPAPADSTLYRMDLATGSVDELFSVAEMAAEAPPGSVRHVLTHVQWNPSGTRFLFFHRFSDAAGGHTRVLTANPDGTGLFELAEELALSHYTWLDDETVLLWSGARGGYAWFRDGEGYAGTLLPHEDGHQTFLPPALPGEPVRWLLGDTYADAQGFRKPFLYDLVTDELIILGRFHHPAAYGGGAHRVDCHPRIDREGRRVIIDSPHEGGRQLYLLDIAGLLRPSATRARHADDDRATPHLLPDAGLAAWDP